MAALVNRQRRTGWRFPWSDGRTSDLRLASIYTAVATDAASDTTDCIDDDDACGGGNGSDDIGDGGGDDIGDGDDDIGDGGGAGDDR